MYKAHYAERGYSCAVGLINRLSFYSRRGIALIRRRGLLCNASSWQLSQCSNPFKPHVACPDTAPAALAGSDSHVAAAVAATPSSFPPDWLASWTCHMWNWNCPSTVSGRNCLTEPSGYYKLLCQKLIRLIVSTHWSRCTSGIDFLLLDWCVVYKNKYHTNNQFSCCDFCFFLLSNTGCNGFRLKYS